MRVIFKSAATPVVLRDPRNDAMNDGVLQFELVLLEEGEDPTPPALKNRPGPAGSGSLRVGTHTLRELRARAAGGPIVIPPPQTTTGGVPVTIPEAVVAPLPDTAAFVLRWQVTPRPQQ
jgi:hypothetical protein